ncbi:NUDIX hydrolase [Phytomonospora endophytica]|uniref:8-oxo-dGTP pyrophosphatase MutT (NUDIX family) n=1 Tax=Phytomonospora endophytica TaxID=714109 RepID=A0A841G3V1_9ACTN|nr:NUDIX domain-containing protein [Phytomonospora endophytica]MBB6039389.1 8-oxo-dGTP pyrophosphatase MutT (NUDIX family) [Phytomonospora endophytica]GIG70117.1 DNA mismatch repair protein MutT [Phytomonospora endophytica]
MDITADKSTRSRVSAYAVTVDERERILLARLSAESAVFEPGLWHLPGGGVDPGEQPVEALARELREETGLALRDARLLDARAYTSTRLGVSWHLVALFYAVDLAPGEPHVTEIDGSTAEVAWLPIAGLDRDELSPPTVDGLAMTAAPGL